ncbi:MAG: metal ABC transporter ATP-binding protein [Desulfovibrio sp.]|nr:metal ABC transporter ATP-binding protein [Desulfovibrio sp.]
MDPAEAIALRGVSVRRGKVPVLEDIRASIPRRGCTMIIGPNGAGKTTLLWTLLGDIPHSGSIDFAPGRDGGRPRLGYVPQNARLDQGLPLTVLEFLTLGLQRSPIWLGLRPGARDRALDFLRLVRAEHLAKRRMGVLSGGETQRVFLALALQREPDILLLDEPSAGMDMQGDLLLCDLLEDLRLARAFTQVMVSHDLGLAAHHATHVLCLKRSLLAQGPPEKVFSHEVLTGLFGVHEGLLSLPLDRKKRTRGKTGCL